VASGATYKKTATSFATYKYTQIQIDIQKVVRWQEYIYFHGLSSMGSVASFPV